MLFNRGDADFELLALVDFALLELGQLRAEVVYFPRKVGLDALYLGVSLDRGVSRPRQCLRRAPRISCRPIRSLW